MKFNSSKERDKYYEKLLDLFKGNKFNDFKAGVSAMNSLNRKSFLVYVFRNKDVFIEFNADIMFKLILDNL